MRAYEWNPEGHRKRLSGFQLTLSQSKLFFSDGLELPFQREFREYYVNNVALEGRLAKEIAAHMPKIPNHHEDRALSHTKHKSQKWFNVQKYWVCTVAMVSMQTGPIQSSHYTMGFHGRIVPDGFASYKMSRNPEIDETKLIVKTDEDVTWLDVSVDYSMCVNVA
jgi:hypothetical protein